MRNASSIAISSKGLMTDLDAESPGPAYGSGTLLNETRIFIRREPMRGATSSQAEKRGDDVALDLARAGVELASDRIAQLALDLVLHHVAIATVDLDRVLAALHPAIADVQLGHRGLQINRLAVTGRPRAMVEHVPGAFDAQFHVHN